MSQRTAIASPRFDLAALYTARLQLRPLAADNAAALLAIYSDPEVMRFLSTPPWASIAVAQDSIAKDLAALPAGQHLRLGVFRREDQHLVGTCSLFALALPSRRAELGYCLGRAAWGQGYMAEGLQVLVQYAFAELGLNRLEADIDPRNGASERALKRLGFRLEGLLRERWIVAGEVSDTALYGLLRSEWRVPATDLS